MHNAFVMTVHVASLNQVVNIIIIIILLSWQAMSETGKAVTMDVERTLLLISTVGWTKTATITVVHDTLQFGRIVLEVVAASERCLRFTRQRVFVVNIHLKSHSRQLTQEYAGLRHG